MKKTKAPNGRNGGALSDLQVSRPDDRFKPITGRRIRRIEARLQRLAAKQMRRDAGESNGREAKERAAQNAGGEQANAD